jgi:ribosomal-protein-alanine N-acetyltransferase
VLQLAHVDFLFSLQEKTNPNPWSRAQTEATLRNSMELTFGGWLGEELVAFLVFRVVLDESEIIEIGVSPDFRRRGFARDILKYGLAALPKSVSVVHLEVRSQNLAAVSLYEALGFAKVGTRPGYYQNPPDTAILMSFMRDKA